MKNVVFLLEEQSAKNLLEGLLPKLLPEGVQAYFMVFQGKQDLEGQLVRKLRGWQRPDSVFVVLRDQDAGRCEDVKKRLGRRDSDSWGKETFSKSRSSGSAGGGIEEVGSYVSETGWGPAGWAAFGSKKQCLA